jgi:hypothetical protein
MRAPLAAIAILMTLLTSCASIHDVKQRPNESCRQDRVCLKLWRFWLLDVCVEWERCEWGNKPRPNGKGNSQSPTSKAPSCCLQPHIAIFSTARMPMSIKD